VEWHVNPAHRRAVTFAPRHYGCLRLHKGWIPGPFLGDGELEIERTLYLDFRGQRAWRATRTYRLGA
jgi:hypothetical protein